MGLRDRVLERLAQIGSDPQDDDDTRAGKALLVLISVLILPVALLWSILYLAFGSPVGWVPLGYFATLLAAIVVFSRTRDFGQLLRVNQVAILFAPTLSMIPLGGFLDAGGVGLWGILAPLGALVFSDVRSATRWFAAWAVVFLGSGTAGELSGGVSSAAVPEWFTSTMLALNVTVGGLLVFTLLAMFADQRRNALAALRVEQAKAENLLLNILPQSIADRLKAEPRTIADQFSSASILFADVVESPDKWHFPYFDDEMGTAVGAGFATAEALLMGRVLYEEWAAYWPEHADEPFGDTMNSIKKYVVSDSLRKADWQNTELIDGDVAAKVAEIKA